MKRRETNRCHQSTVSTQREHEYEKKRETPEVICPHQSRPLLTPRASLNREKKLFVFLLFCILHNAYIYRALHIEYHNFEFSFYQSALSLSREETRSFLNPKFVLRLLSPIEIGPLFRGEKPQHQHSRELYLLSFNLRALLSFNLRALLSLI